MAAKKKELLEHEEPVAIGTENTDAVTSGTLLTEGTADGMDGPTAFGEAEPGLDELLAGMDQDPEGAAYFAGQDSGITELPGADEYDEAAGTNDSGSLTPDGAASEELSPAKPKRTTGRKRKAAEHTEAIKEVEAASEITETNDSEMDAAPPAKLTEFTEDLTEGRESAATAPPPAPRRASRSRPAAEAPVLTIEARSEVETAEEREEVIWHEIHNAYRTRRILMGQLCGIEQTDAGKTIAIADYKGFRIVIPLKEMMIQMGRSPSGQADTDLMLRQNKILNNMLGAHIDFVVKGIDSKTRSVVASRQEAMLKKRQIFYLDSDSAGMYRIYEGRVVQARIIAVAEKVIRVEIFGVECSIMARDLAWDWVGDAHERFSVGDEVLVRILGVRRDSLEDVGVKADIKSVTQNNNSENLKKCRIQSKYAGKVTDVHKGVVYVRLSNGVNAVAHSCYDQRMPGKKDDVSFAVTRIDEERGVAVGIITRIIRQNL